MDKHARRVALQIGLVVAPPLLLALLECFHPHPKDMLALPVERWLFVHYLQIGLFPLTALTVASLLRGRTDGAATCSRIALFMFATTFVAFDTAAGVVTGILVHAAHASGNAEAWRVAIDTVWTHPIIGGIRQPGSVSFAYVGSIGLAIGAAAASASMRDAGRPWTPLLLLLVSGFGLMVFHTHAWPGGPLTFGGIAIANGWLCWHAARAAVTHRDGRLLLQARAAHDRRRNWRPARSHPASALRHTEWTSRSESVDLRTPPPAS